MAGTIDGVLCRLSTCRQQEDGTFSVVCKTVKSFFVYRFVSRSRVSASFRLSGSVRDDSKDVYEVVTAQAGIPPRQRELWRYGFVNEAVWEAHDGSRFARRPVELFDAPRPKEDVPGPPSINFDDLLK